MRSEGQTGCACGFGMLQHTNMLLPLSSVGFQHESREFLRNVGMLCIRTSPTPPPRSVSCDGKYLYLGMFVHTKIHLPPLLGRFLGLFVQVLVECKVDFCGEKKNRLFGHLV